MKKILLLFFFFFMNWQLYAQITDTNEPESIGFAFGASAHKSPIFKEVEEFVKKKDYNFIPLFLSSEVASEVLIGTMICQKLLENNEIHLTDAQRDIYNDNFNSKLMLTVRSGCTCSEIVTIKELLKGSKTCGFSASLKYWVNDLSSSDQLR